MATIVPNLLESFSAELRQEMFRYFSANDVWHSFHGLTARIDTIIDQANLDLDFRHSGTYTYFAREILPSMNVINVRSLRSSEHDKTKHFFSKYPLDSLVQLRALSLHWIYSCDDPSFKLWNQLTSLKYLRSLNIMFFNLNEPETCIEEKEFIIHSIFNKDFCPLLEHFSIEVCGDHRWKHAIPLITTMKATNIKYMSIDSLAFNELIKLFPAMQNVK